MHQRCLVALVTLSLSLAAAAAADAPQAAAVGASTPSGPNRAEVPGAAQAATLASSVRAATDPSVSPPLNVDPASLKGLYQHALLQQKVGFYAVLVPPDYELPKNRARRYPVVLILHGGASSEVRHGKLADAFGRKDVIYVVPRAAYPNEPVILKEQRIAWSAQPTYPAVWGDKDSSTFPTSEVASLDVQGLYIGWIEQVLSDARKRYRVSPDKALVVGHSQGGLFAHLLALRRPELVKAYFAYAGLFDATTKTPDDARAADLFKLHGIQPYLSHHENDERVPVQQTRDLATYLVRHGVKHSVQIWPGGDHMLDTEVHAAVRRFITEQTQRK